MYTSIGDVSTWGQLEAGSSVYTNPELSVKNRVVAAKMTALDELVEPADDFHIGAKSGDKVSVPITGRIASLSTTPLSETSRVPLAEPPRHEFQAQVFERGLGIMITQRYESLDRIDNNETNVVVLRDHMARTHNKVINDALIAARSFTYVPLSASTFNFDTDGTPTGTANAAFSFEHAVNLSERLVSFNVPYADGENYIMGISPRAYYAVVKDTRFQEIAKYRDSGGQGVLNGEVGKMANLRFVIDNDALANGIGTGSAFGSGIVVGAEGCKEVVGPWPPHFRVNTNFGGDFGRASAMAWLSFQGYAVPWNFTAHGDGRVCHYTSA